MTDEIRESNNTINQIWKSTHKTWKIVLFVVLLIILSTITINTHAIDKDQQDAIAEKLKATFNKTTFNNFGPSPIDGLWQAEISGQVVYFSPKQELMLFGEIYTKDGISLSEKTKREWQSKRVSKLDVSDAMIIGDGPIEIIEFTDPDCPFCQRFGIWADTQNKDGKNLFTRKVIMTPIDSLHPNAHKEAVHVLCTDKDNQAKALSNVLNGKISYADMLSCDIGKALLEKHRVISKKFNIAATPTLILDKQVIQGFNQQKLEQIINVKIDQLNNKK